MNWKTPKENKPPQGLKVLCVRTGDFYVAQRFGEYWLSIPFYDSVFRQFQPPDLWTFIEFPDNYKGVLLFGLTDQDGLITLDELEKLCPEDYETFVGENIDLFDIKADFNEILS